MQNQTLKYVYLYALPPFGMDKLKPTGQNLGRVFYFRSGCMCATHFSSYEAKLSNLKLKTRVYPVRFCFWSKASV
jgi:hypothetical protein